MPRPSSLMYLRVTYSMMHAELSKFLIHVSQFTNDTPSRTAGTSAHVGGQILSGMSMRRWLPNNGCTRNSPPIKASHMVACSGEPAVTSERKDDEVCELAGVQNGLSAFFPTTSMATTDANSLEASGGGDGGGGAIAELGSGGIEAGGLG